MPAVVFQPCKGLHDGLSIEVWTSEPRSCVRRMKKRRGAAMQHWEYAVADFTKLERAVPELLRWARESGLPNG